ncbi:helix-turn-helix transcriptional regulator [Streptomyces sp. NBC_00433]
MPAESLRAVPTSSFGTALPAAEEHLVLAEAHDLALPMYLALKRLGSGTLSEVCAAIGTPVRAAESAWRHLQALSLVRPTGRGEAFAPVDPDGALKKLLDLQRQRLREQSAELAQTHRRVQDLLGKFRPAAMRHSVDSSVEVSFVADRAERTERLRSLHLSSQTEMWSMHPGPLPSAAVLDRSLELDAELVARGLRVRAVYGHTVAAGTRARKYLSALASLGAEVRLARQVPFDLLLFDSRTAVMPSTPSQPDHPMLVLNGSKLMGTYIAMYDDVWSRSAPLFSDEGGDEEGAGTLSDRQLAVLRLLTAGLTDEQIGRRLGISTRTVGRISSEVMEQIGATSRFQAGALAALLGLVAQGE